MAKKKAALKRVAKKATSKRANRKKAETVSRLSDQKKPPKPKPLPQNKHPFQHDYYTDGTDVFWGIRRKLTGADRATFEPLNNTWAKDSKGVFCQYTRMRTADPKTFQVLNYIFAKDKNNVHYIMGIAKGLDAMTFRVLDDGMYADDTLLRKPATQRNHRDFTHLGYGMDKNGVYFHNMMSGKPKAVRGADPQTFQRLEFAYAKDAKHCYYRESRMKGSDPATFSVLSEMFAKDQEQVYCCWEPIPEADPKTFKVLKPKQPSSIYFGRDKNHVFFHFDGVHPTTHPRKFKVVNGELATDGTVDWDGMDAKQDT